MPATKASASALMFSLACLAAAADRELPAAVPPSAAEASCALAEAANGRPRWVHVSASSRDDTSRSGMKKEGRPGPYLQHGGSKGAWGCHQLAAANHIPAVAVGCCCYCQLSACLLKLTKGTGAGLGACLASTKWMSPGRE